MTSNLSTLDKFFTARGYTTPDIALLQPADPFLDTAGEDMRARIFMTADRGGSSLCLRPEFTIPVCLAHLQSGNAQGRYAYGGKVFRQRQHGAAEFAQAGIETIGGEQSVTSDVECIETALAALAQCGVKKMQVVIGDQEIFEALLAALELPEHWRARLARDFGDSAKLEDDLKLITNGNDEIDGLESQLRKALEADDFDSVAHWVTDKMNAANLPHKGGRTAHDIATRMMTKAQLASVQLNPNQRKILREFLAIEVPVDQAAAHLREFAKAANLNLDAALNAFEERAALLGKFTDKDVTITWRASFGRRLDYYTGIVFEISQIGQGRSNKPLCGGGRYDRLMNMLGALKPTPAIGFSIWLDRLEGGTK